MAETTPVPHVLEIEDSLTGPREQIVHRHYKEGNRYELRRDETGVTDLEMYPNGSVVRFVSPSVEVTVSGLRHYEISGEGVVFHSRSETDKTMMRVTRDGDLTFAVSQKPRVQEERTAIEDELPDRAEPQQTAVDPSSNTKEETERKERVEITGRVGRDPRLTKTKGGTDVAKFSLAEHPNGNEGETVWHTIVSFKERAIKAAEEIKKGQTLTVIGYPNEYEYNGQPRREINAIVFRSPKSPQAPAEPAPQS